MQPREIQAEAPAPAINFQEVNPLDEMMQQLYDGIADVRKPVVSIERIQATTAIASNIFRSLGEETAPLDQLYVAMRLFELKISPLIGDAKQRLTCPIRIALECSLRLLHSKFLLVTRQRTVN